EIANQAANATVSIEKLQAAFNNIYATIDTIDTFKLAALDSMRKTIDSLSAEILRAKEYMERARSAELAQARANGLVSELTLPASGKGAWAMWLVFVPLLVLFAILAAFGALAAGVFAVLGTSWPWLLIALGVWMLVRGDVRHSRVSRRQRRAWA